MRITVNGEPHEVDPGTTLAALLARLEAPAHGVAVERNRAIVRRRDWNATPLEPGDRIELVTLVGGG